MRRVTATSLATIVLLTAGIYCGNLETLPSETSTCPSSLALPMLNADNITDFENGSISYEGRVYPPAYHRWDHSRNVTLGCVCKLPGFKCVRKCCPGSQVLDSNNTCSLPALSNEGVQLPVPALGLPEQSLAPEIENITRLDEEFYLVESGFLCSGKKYPLEPNDYPEDEFVLDTEGALKTDAGVIEPGRYCLDWLDDLETVRVFVCYVEEVENKGQLVKLDTKMYPVGMIISLPFLLATFLVYAIIPELRNLYGMTLMCYVACLVVAYTMLAVIQLTKLNDTTCIALGGALVDFDVDVYIDQGTPLSVYHEACSNFHDFQADFFNAEIQHSLRKRPHVCTPH